MLPSRRWWVLATGVVLLAALMAWPDRPGRSSPDPPAAAGTASIPPEMWRDRFGDGWPDAARLDRPEDRDNFRRWITYLAESAYYRPTPASQAEVSDCAALIRYAYRNALAEHSAAWRQTVALAAAPGFGNIQKFAYPNWPLGRGLFRTEAGPFQLGDLERPVFQEFADAQSLMRFNAYPLSPDLRAARPGDLIFFRQPEQAEPFHVMLFVGKSNFQPRGNDWIVYHTGSVNGAPGEVRHVQASVLAQHPEARWRPNEGNPRFLGVYRFSILR